MATVLITGSTGMVGKGVLLECIQDDRIDKVILVNRSTIKVENEKIEEVFLQDFLQFKSIADQLSKIDACFHCMGVSSVGMDEETYRKLTFGITKEIVDVCYDNNPEMTFNYVSGQGTDSSESGRIMWTRVKGKTENYILEKGFSQSFMFRPGIIIPEKGIRSSTKLYDRLYQIMRPIFPLLKRLKSVVTTSLVGQAMLETHFNKNLEDVYLTNKDMNQLMNKK